MVYPLLYGRYPCSVPTEAGFYFRSHSELEHKRPRFYTHTTREAMADKSACCEKRFSDTTLHADVKDYYGKVLKKSSDLKTNACVTPAKPVPAFIRQALKSVHPEVSDKYYGCGLVVPECLEGCKVLDLGSGSGRDCYMLSKLVGERGHVTGIDMTDDQLEVARKYVDYHMQEFGYKKANINFVQGYIEALSEAGLEKNAFDIIISNCVVNLSPDKKRVLTEAYHVLKDGGELYFSDVYSSSRLTDEIKNHKVLWGECIGGALWWEDLLQLAEEVGFSPPRLVTASEITVDNKDLQDILGDFKFVSATYRLFKVPKNTAKACQVVYNGNITGEENVLVFDCQYTFKVNEIVEVDEAMASILTHSRFAEEFTFQPPGAPSESCTVKPKATVNPFELMSQKLGTGSPASTTGGCGGPRSSACCK